MNPSLFPGSVLAFDSETELIQPWVKAPRLVCISWCGADGSGLFKWDGEGCVYAVPAEIRRWLTGHSILVGHNIAYDMAVLANQWPDLLPLIFQAYEDNRVTDTMLRQKLVDIAMGELDHPKFRVGKSFYSLECLALRHLGKQLDKDTWRLRYGELRDVPLADWPQGAKDYPVEDAVSTLQVYQAQEKHAHLLEDQFRQSRHAFWLHLMSCWGIKTDKAAVARLEANIRDELEGITADLVTSGLLRPNGVRDTKAARVRMAEVSGLGCKMTEPSKTFPGGQISLDDEACRASKDPCLIAYADYTHLSGMLSKDIEALRGGEVHARINSLLETGRTSAGGSAETGGYNIQNPARKGGVRECFIPRDGWVFVDADYDGLELRTMSQACLELVGQSTMADVLNRGEDPHLMLAARLLGCDYSEAVRRYQAKEPAAKEARQFAKIGNFGLAGGMGVDTFVEYASNNGIEIEPQQAKIIKDTWLEQWPEFREYFARAAAMVEGGEAQVEQLFSRRYRGGLGFSQLCNTYFQGLGADAAKAAGWAISRACYDSSETNKSVLFGCRIVNFIHDQFLVEVPDDALAHDRAQEVGRLMVQEANKWLPDVPATTTPCLARCWSKDATAVYDANGRLIPWEPVKEEKRAA